MFKKNFKTLTRTTKTIEVINIKLIILNKK